MQQFVFDRAHVLGVEHGAHLLEHARSDGWRQHVTDVLADAIRVRKRRFIGGDGVTCMYRRRGQGARAACHHGWGSPCRCSGCSDRSDRSDRSDNNMRIGATVGHPRAGARMAGLHAAAVAEGALVARRVIEVDAILVHAKKRIGNGGQDGAVVRVRDAQAHDGIAGAQHVQDAVAQYWPIDGLRHEVGGARFVGAGDGFDIIAAGDHDDRHRGAVVEPADRAAGGKAIHVRHVDVEQDQVGRARVRQRQRLFTVVGFDRVQADLAEHFEHQHAHHGIVVGNQHHAADGEEGGTGSGRGCCHVMFPFRGGH